MIEWFIVVLNILICLWDSYAGGILWGSSKDNIFYKMTAMCALIIGFVGLLYSFVLIGVLTNYLPETYLILSNVFLGIPLIGAGIVITIQGWIDSIRHRSIFGILISLWNTFAMFWNIKVWIDSVKMLSEIGIGKALEGDGDSKIKIIIFLIIALIVAVAISFGLFFVGEKKGKEMSLNVNKE